MVVTLNKLTTLIANSTWYHSTRVSATLLFGGTTLPGSVPRYLVVPLDPGQCSGIWYHATRISAALPSRYYSTPSAPSPISALHRQHYT